MSWDICREYIKNGGSCDGKKPCYKAHKTNGVCDGWQYADDDWQYRDKEDYYEETEEE